MRIAQSRTETGRLKMGPFLCSDLATWSGVSGEGLSFLHLAFLLWGTRERLCLSSVIHEHTKPHTYLGRGRLVQSLCSLSSGNCERGARGKLVVSPLVNNPRSRLVCLCSSQCTANCTHTLTHTHTHTHTLTLVPLEGWQR